MKPKDPGRQRREFERLVKLSPEEQRAAVEQLRAEDASLADAMSSLLRWDEAGPTLSRDGAHQPARDAARDPLIGVSFDGYTITRAIGQGGMGAVYAAIEANPPREVAIKVIKPERELGGGWSAEQMRKRFETECALLGRLDSDAIARVYRAGRAEIAGYERQYVVMELIRGLPLTQHVSGRRTNDTTVDALGIRERLDLLANVAEAVEHAHAEQIVHLDLKPSNVLVTDDGRVKVLDFGLARAMKRPDGQDLTQTQSSSAPGGTPEYMAPEQVWGRPGEIDQRSDVYALGVIMYELLSGERPHKVNNRPLAVYFDELRDDSSLPARLRTYNRSFRGDLETISEKALAKDRAERYPSANAFAADIRRYLRHEPILALPASTWDQARKFAKRNKVLVGSATALLMLTIAFSIVVLQLYVGQVAATEANERLLAESYARQAELEVAQGNWSAALVNYEEALDRGQVDTAEIELGIIRSLFSLNRDAEALKRARALLSLPDLGPAEAEARLWLGYLTLNEQRGGREAGLAQIRAALDQGTLAPSDAAFGRALLAETIPAALVHLNESLSLDPFNRDTTLMVGLLSMIVGEVEPARIAVAHALSLKPADPLLNTVSALLAALDEDFEAVDAGLAVAAESLPERDLTQLRAMTIFLGEFRDRCRALLSADQATQITDRIMFSAEFIALVPMFTANEKSGESVFQRLVDRLPPCVSPFADLVEVLREPWRFLEGDTALEITQNICRIAPSGHAYLLLAIIYGDRGQYEDALQAYELAESLPSLFDHACPCVAGRVDARLGLILQDSVRTGEDRRTAYAETLSRLSIEFLEECADSFFMGPHQLRTMVEIMAPNGEPETARETVFIAMRLLGKSPTLLYAQALADFHLGAFGPCITALDEVLAEEPDNAAALALRERAATRLRELVDAGL